MYFKSDFSDSLSMNVYQILNTAEAHTDAHTEALNIYLLKKQIKQCSLLILKEVIFKKKICSR